MKIFHLSDLHIGLKLMNHDLREDQEYILHQIVERAREEKPEAILIAGDIYDKAVPAAEAFRSFSIPYPMHECGSGGISPPCPVYGHADALPAGILIQAVFVRHHLPTHAFAGWLSGSVSRAVRLAVCPGL